MKVYPEINVIDVHPGKVLEIIKEKRNIKLLAIDRISPLGYTFDQLRELREYKILFEIDTENLDLACALLYTLFSEYKVSSMQTVKLE